MQEPEVEREISKDQYISWRKNDKVTEVVFASLQEERDAIANAISLGMYLSDPVNNAIQVGIVRGMDKLLNIEYEDEEVPEKEVSDYDH
jgi:hypothetical protein